MRMPEMARAKMLLTMQNVYFWRNTDAEFECVLFNYNIFNLTRLYIDRYIFMRYII